MNAPSPSMFASKKKVTSQSSSPTYVSSDSASSPKSEPSTPASESKQPKKPFSLKPHLTDRPFQNDALKELRDSMQKKDQRRQRNQRVNIKSK